IDPVVVDRNAPGRLVVGVEVKFEPDRSRAGEEARRLTEKRPVTAWTLIAKDHEKIRARVADAGIDVGYTLLVDESGHYRRSRTPPPSGEWQLWGKDTEKK